MDQPRSQAENQPRSGEDASEQRLLERMRADDQRAFEEVVRRYGPRMLAVARRFLEHEQDAQDAVQDAFMSAFRSIDRFQGDAKLATWLHRIVVNAALMKLRKKQRRSETSIDDLLPSFTSDGHLQSSRGDWAIHEDEAIENQETRDLIRKCIHALPEPHRTILLLRDIEEMNTEETAKLLEISPGAVKTRLHRARQALRTLMDDIMSGGKA